MNRLELNKKIIDIYASTLYEFKKNEFSKSINSNLTTVFLMQKDIEKKMKNILPEVTGDYLANFNVLIDNLKNELKILLPEGNIDSHNFSDFCKNKTSDYLKAVSDFTSSGNVGFYDIGLRLNSRKNIEEIENFIDIIDNSNLDFAIIDKDYSHDDKFISLMMPSSLLKEFNELSEQFRADNVQMYFIAPRVTDINSLTIKNVENIISDYKNLDTWSNYFLIEDSFTSLGYSRHEIYSSTSEELERSIFKMLINITLYSANKNEHINGIMPTNYMYDLSEIKEFNIDVSGYNFENSEMTKPINIVDDLTILNSNRDISLKKTNKIKIK